jgi:hypothetical protein
MSIQVTALSAFPPSELLRCSMWGIGAIEAPMMSEFCFAAQGAIAWFAGKQVSEIDAGI